MKGLMSTTILLYYFLFKAFSYHSLDIKSCEENWAILNIKASSPNRIEDFYHHQILHHLISG